MAFDDVERALDALELRGARAFDDESCTFVRALATRGAALPAAAAAIVHARARAHVARLQARFEDALRATRAQLESAEHTHGALPEQRAALGRGELTGLRRDLRRLERRRRAAAHAVRAKEHRRCAGEYEAAAAELRAQFAVARAVEDVPLDAGPYNALRIATDLLARIGEVSPAYLAVQLQRLDELAVMLTLPEPPPPPAAPKQPPKPRRRAARRR